MQPLEPAEQYNIICDGNSIVAGDGVTRAYWNWPDRLARALGARFTVTNNGYSGQTTQQMIDQFDNAGRPGAQVSATKKNILICWEVTNDIFFNSDTASNTMARWATYVAAGKAAGYYVIALNVLARSGFDAGQNTIRDGCNALFVSNSGKIYGDQVLNANATILDSSLTYMADGTHPNDYACAILMPVIRQAIWSTNHL